MRGRRVPLSAARRLIGDLLHFAAGVPTVPVQRRMQLGALLAARRGCPDRPPWVVLFTKGLALVAAEVPELRRAYCKFPRPHLYEYPASVASVMVERQIGDEPAVLGLVLKDPAGRPLAELAVAIRHAQTATVSEVKSFARALLLARLPRPVRRLLWWLGLNVGRQRANYFGTFGVTVYSGLGAESLHPLSPLTSTLNYGVIAPDGAVDVRLTYDHRVMDGATVARALARLERVLNTAVAAELLYPSAVAA